MEENNIIYNPDWFNQQPESVFMGIADDILNRQNQEIEKPGNLTGSENQEEMLSLYEDMKAKLEELQSYKQNETTNDSNNSDDYSDLDDFKAIFGEDDVNTPVDWNAYSNHKYSNEGVASTIYNTVLSKTGDAQKARNAINIAQHESLLNPQIVNNFGMVGLYQFSKDNQRKYNISPKSSIEEQTTAWLKYQDDNNIPIGQEGVGQIAPAYIGREVLYSKGQKAYSNNKALDLDKNGHITSTEANNWFGINNNPSKYTTSEQSFKPIKKSKSVNVSHINPNLQNWYNQISPLYGGLTVTSGQDGKHSTNSKHYHGDALDIRSKDAQGKKLKNDVETKGKFVEQQSRGPVYLFNGVKVLIEKDHLHINT